MKDVILGILVLGAVITLIDILIPGITRSEIRLQLSLLVISALVIAFKRGRGDKN